MDELKSPLAPLTPIDKIYSTLAADFSEDIVERTWSDEKYDQINGQRVKRRGSGTRKGYDTASIPKQALVDRLNEVVGLGRWSVEIEGPRVDGTKLGTKDAYRAFARLRILIPGISCATPWVTAEHVTWLVSDAEQGAVTMAFKRACSWLSLGRQVWLGEFDEDLSGHVEAPKVQQQPQQSQQSQQSNNVGPVQQPAADSVEAKLIEEIYKTLLPALWSDLAESPLQRAQALHFIRLGKLKLPKVDKSSIKAFLLSLTQAQLGEVRHNLKKHADDPDLVIPDLTDAEVSAELEWLK